MNALLGSANGLVEVAFVLRHEMARSLGVDALGLLELCAPSSLATQCAGLLPSRGFYSMV